MDAHEIRKYAEWKERQRRKEMDLTGLDNIYKYHPPKDDQAERYQFIRETGKDLALAVLRNCPDSRERSLALTKIEEACFWANAAIARNE